jgi:hypothetical protein
MTSLTQRLSRPFVFTKLDRLIHPEGIPVNVFRPKSDVVVGILSAVFCIAVHIDLCFADLPILHGDLFHIRFQVAS